MALAAEICRRHYTKAVKRAGGHARGWGGDRAWRNASALLPSPLRTERPTA